MNRIQDIVDDQINKLSRCLAAIKGNKLEIKTIEINSNFLEENYRNSQTFSKCANFKDLYNGLPKNVPVLYWFTFDPEKLKGDALKQAYKYMTDIPEERKISEIPKTLRESNGTLYVGKVIDKFHYRFVNHLGHSVSGKTVSLQLTYWYDTAIYGNLKLNYIVLEKEMKTLLGVLEIELAKELRPIVGSHKN
jgi:hypothetical protein